MADTVVNFLLENVCQMLQKEADLLLGVKDEVKSLLDKLEVMKSFLRDCGEVRQEHEAVKVIINQIRDVAYEADDAIDEYITSAAQARTKGTLSRFFHGFSKVLTERGVAKMIEDIKKKMDNIYANKTTFGIEIKMRTSEVGSSSGGPRRKAPVVEETDVVGFKNETTTLVKRLTAGKPQRLVVSIVGMGGLGKTTLAKKIYKDPSVKIKFDRCCAWVYVSQDYRPTELLRNIIKQFTRITEEMEKMSEEELGKVLQNQLTGLRYLIVMDDVWKSQVWRDLGTYFPDQKNGSRIMITTRDTEVALQANPDPKSPPHLLRYLDEDESWELFHKKAFLGETCSQQWEELGRQIAKRCGGLPLALVVLGGLLSEKERNFTVWSRVADRVSIFLSERKDQCADILALSYDDLPYNLKPCFLYFGIFPEDSEIPARQLMQLWMAEGFIQARDGETMEDTADAYLEKLVNRSLVQVVTRRSDYGVKTCRIHDLLRDLCIIKAGEERFLQVHGYANSKPLANPRRLAGNQDTLVHICREPRTVVQVRSLLCFTQTSSKSKSESKSDNLIKVFKTLPLLRVFWIDGSSGNVPLPSDVGKLIHLRYLGMMNKTSLIKIPSSVCNIWNLQTLDMRSRHLPDAPSGIWKMKRLRHVYFQGQTRLPRPSSSSSSSSSSGYDDSSLGDLQTLSTICPSSCTPQVFAQLPDLRKLGVNGDLEAHMEALLNNLTILQKLQSLKLVRNTSSSALTEIPSRLPLNLIKLTLCDTELSEDPMPVLGKLPKLQMLKLVGNSYSEDQMVCSANGFPLLQLLQLVRSKVTDLIINQGAMPNLNRLIVHDCLHFNLHSAESQLTAQKPIVTETYSSV